MIVIGIIGGVGSGKSAVLNLLAEEYGFLPLETDLIAKELMRNGTDCHKALVAAFGKGILRPDGEIDAAAYAKLIYGDAAALLLSDAIVHPAVWALSEKRISAVREREGRKTGEKDAGPGAEAAEKAPDNVRGIALETALPDERFRTLCTEIWCVSVPAALRIKRLSEGRGYTREKCLSVMEHQRTEAEYAAFADLVIDNSGAPEAVKEAVQNRMAALGIAASDSVRSRKPQAEACKKQTENLD